MTAETLVQEQVVILIINALDGFSGDYYGLRLVKEILEICPDKLHKTRKSAFPTMQIDSVFFMPHKLNTNCL